MFKVFFKGTLKFSLNYLIISFKAVYNYVDNFIHNHSYHRIIHIDKTLYTLLYTYKAH